MSLCFFRVYEFYRVSCKPWNAWTIRYKQKFLLANYIHDHNASARDVWLTTSRHTYMNWYKTVHDFMYKITYPHVKTNDQRSWLRTADWLATLRPLNKKWLIKLLCNNCYMTLPCTHLGIYIYIYRQLRMFRSL